MRPGTEAFAITAMPQERLVPDVRHRVRIDPFQPWDECAPLSQRARSTLVQRKLTAGRPLNETILIGCLVSNAMAGDHFRSQDVSRPPVQGLHQVIVQVLRVLEPHGKPKQVARTWRARTFNRCAVLDEALDPTSADVSPSSHSPTLAAVAIAARSPAFTRIESMPPNPPFIWTRRDRMSRVLSETRVRRRITQDGREVTARPAVQPFRLGSLP